MIMNKLFIRNVFLTVILILLLVLIFLIRGRSPFGKRQSSFAVMPDREITSIELSRNRETVTLELDKNGWIVNGEPEARKSSIMFLVRILKEMKIKSPVSPELFDNEIISKEVHPVRVRVYENRRLLRSFYVYITGSNIYGNIMRRNKRTKPFIVHVPGYEDNIGSAFNPSQLYWLPYTVFNVLPSEISSVTLENVTDPASSFIISGTVSKYQLSDLKNTLSGWDSSRVKRYISYFTMVPFESWAPEMSESEKKRLGSESPVFRIKVIRSDGSEIKLDLWERYVNGKKDKDRLWGKTGDREEYFVIRYFDIDPLLKKIDYFFPE